MISYFQAIVLGALQGVTELFPISSLGHSVILPALLGWNIDQSGSPFLVFLVATHFATALVLLGFFWKDWVRIFQGLVRSIVFRRINGDTHAKLGWLIIIATIPGGILGLLLEKRIGALFAAPSAAAVFLIVNGCILYGAEKIKRKRVENVLSSDEEIAKLSWTKSFFVGCAQALALIPGISRTGSALSGGLLSGIDHESAARFAFLLATPIIFAAAFLKLPALFHSGYPAGATLIGALAAALGAYLSVRFLIKYFQTKTLVPFALYCIIFGAISFVVLLFR
jgi:undecaprenyl-diphosphatase